MSLKDEKRAKVKDLTTLALDDAATAEERSSTAVRAIKIIRKYELLDLTPVEGILEHPTVRAAKVVADKLVDSELTGAFKVLLKQGAEAVAASRRRR